jgi:hypothetical protein
MENACLSRIQEGVESAFLDDAPRFHHPSAYVPSYDPHGSSIFVVDYSAFSTMNALTIHEVFRHRHIMVTDVPTDEMHFDLIGLSSLGSLLRPVDIQGKSNLFHIHFSHAHAYDSGTNEVR